MFISPGRRLHSVPSWQARRELNPQQPVLETGALPIELLAYPLKSLLDLPMDGVFPFETAELFDFYAFRGGLLVSGRRVVPPFAVLTRQGYDFSGHVTFLLRLKAALSSRLAP
jgi:hypothetical protein